MPASPKVQNIQKSKPLFFIIMNAASDLCRIIEKFRGLRWIPLEPEFIDYANAQFILIGSSGDFEHGTMPQKDDERAEKDTPAEEMENLAEENGIRIEHLKGKAHSDNFHAQLIPSPR